MRAIALALLVLCACGRGTAYPSASARPTGLERAAILVMENHEYEQIIGSPQAPYLNGLASRSALATNLFATTHPSFPNYLALLGGDTFGATADCAPCHFPQRNLVDQLEAAGISWKAYMQGMPGPCFHRDGVRYLRRHNPFAYFTSIDRNSARCEHVVPLTELDRDMMSLPRFVWITPDDCNDMHSCPISTGDRFLAGLVPKLLTALGPRGALFIAFDEGRTQRGCCTLARGGHVVTIVAGGAARPGTYTQPFDHYSILRAIEDGFGLPRLANAACPCTPSMDALFRPT